MNQLNEVSILISFIAGVLTFLSPCILPLFPSYITYITGKSYQDITILDLKGDIKRQTALHSLFFIIGFSIIFVLLGITVSYLGSFFGLKRLWLERIGGGLIIIFGLQIMGVFNIGFLSKEKRLSYKKRKVRYLESLLVGMAFAIGWTPCVGPILSSILIYAGTIETLPRAILLLSVYSIGIGVPFFILSLAVNRFIFVFNRFKGVIRFIPVVTGVFLICIGGLLFLGRFSMISGIFIR